MISWGEGTKGKSTGHCILRGRSQTLGSHPATAQSPSGLSRPWDCPCSLVSPALPDRPGSGLRMSSEPGTWGFPLIYPRIYAMGTTVHPLKACCSPGGYEYHWTRVHAFTRNDRALKHGSSVLGMGVHYGGWTIQILPDCVYLFIFNIYFYLFI